MERHVGHSGCGQREKRTKEGAAAKLGGQWIHQALRMAAPAEGEQAERGLYCIWQYRAAGMPACHDSQCGSYGTCVWRAWAAGRRRAEAPNAAASVCCRAVHPASLPMAYWKGWPGKPPGMKPPGCCCCCCCCCCICASRCWCIAACCAAACACCCCCCAAAAACICCCCCCCCWKSAGSWPGPARAPLGGLMVWPLGVRRKPAPGEASPADMRCSSSL